MRLHASFGVVAPFGAILIPMKGGDTMKNFDDFKKYVIDNREDMHTSIHQKVLSIADKQKFNDSIEEHEFYRRAWVGISVMEMLEHYHNWLSI